MSEPTRAQVLAVADQAHAALRQLMPELRAYVGLSLVEFEALPQTIRERAWNILRGTAHAALADQFMRDDELETRP